MKGVFGLVGLLLALAIVGVGVCPRWSQPFPAARRPRRRPRCVNKASRCSSNTSRPSKGSCSNPGPCRMKNDPRCARVQSKNRSPRRPWFLGGCLPAKKCWKN